MLMRDSSGGSGWPQPADPSGGAGVGLAEGSGGALGSGDGVGLAGAPRTGVAVGLGFGVVAAGGRSGAGAGWVGGSSELQPPASSASDARPAPTSRAEGARVIRARSHAGAWEVK